MKTKSNVWAEVQEVLVANKAKQTLIDALEAILKPKTGGGVVQYPMKTIDDMNYHYCRYCATYIVESEMVMSNGKSKGYSKKAIAKWTKLGKEAQKLNDEAMKLLLNNQIVEGQDKAKEADELKNKRNYSTLYEDIAEEYRQLGFSTEA
jgi:hypothetical protein